MNGRDRHYLSLVTAPEGVSRTDLARALHERAGLDAQTVALNLGRTPPCILGLYDPGPCEGAMSTILDLGGDAFACSLSDLQALGATQKIKDLELRHGALAGTLWRGGPFTIDPKQIQILIRVKLSQTHTKPPPAGLSRVGSGRTHAGPVIYPTGFAMGGAYGTAMMLYAHHEAASFSWDRSIKTSDKLDIHLDDGRIYQIDGDKFGFQILGDQRGMSDHVNIDRMCELLAHLAPDEVVDPYFSLWTAPVGHQRLRIPGMKVNNDNPKFAFYSRWAALMYRHVMGA